MIRKRIPHQDDPVIYQWVVQLLVPFALETQPDLRVDMATIRKRLKPNVTFVDTGGGRAARGFISLRMAKDKMYIDMLAVDPRWQGKGVGSLLMKHAERTGIVAGYREVNLWVDEANVQAQRFYASKGYEAMHFDAGLRCYFLSKPLQMKSVRY
ncbi:GNAT family N-acetyltransferase [Paenibacillus rigui]|uniref:GNAT family N-acetyltransferase n=1 Tax=Paenibacillus rigui TaxID=554312 RepID=A0A229UKF5_9BACL|nr:GNAT family N-acetyltransferase [Paenibacillus rigui]OXM83389.1 GNAT family N-acetyltransferase [Paenibacillus rigui]